MYYKEMACRGGARKRGPFLERGKGAVWKKGTKWNYYSYVQYNSGSIIPRAIYYKLNL